MLQLAEISVHSDAVALCSIVSRVPLSRKITRMMISSESKSISVSREKTLPFRDSKNVFPLNRKCFHSDMRAIRAITCTPQLPAGAVIITKCTDRSVCIITFQWARMSAIRTPGRRTSSITYRLNGRSPNSEP